MSEKHFICVVGGLVLVPMILSFIAEISGRKPLDQPCIRDFDSWFRKLLFHRWIVDGWRPFSGLGLTKSSVRLRALFSFFSASIVLYSVLRYVFGINVFENIAVGNSKLASHGEAVILFVVSSIGSYLAFYQIYLNEFVSKYRDLRSLYERYDFDDPRELSSVPEKNKDMSLGNTRRYHRIKFLDTSLNFRLESNPTFRFEVAAVIKELIEVRKYVGRENWKSLVEPFQFVGEFFEVKSDSELEIYEAKAQIVNIVIFNSHPPQGEPPDEGPRNVIDKETG